MVSAAGAKHLWNSGGHELDESSMASPGSDPGLGGLPEKRRASFFFFLF